MAFHTSTLNWRPGCQSSNRILLRTSCLLLVLHLLLLVGIYPYNSVKCTSPALSSEIYAVHPENPDTAGAFALNGPVTTVTSKCKQACGSHIQQIRWCSFRLLRFLPVNPVVQPAGCKTAVKILWAQRYRRHTLARCSCYCRCQCCVGSTDPSACYLLSRLQALLTYTPGLPVVIRLQLLQPFYCILYLSHIIDWFLLYWNPLSF